MIQNTEKPWKMKSMAGLVQIRLLSLWERARGEDLAEAGKQVEAFCYSIALVSF